MKNLRGTVAYTNSIPGHPQDCHMFNIYCNVYPYLSFVNNIFTNNRYRYLQFTFITLNPRLLKAVTFLQLAHSLV